MEASLCFVCLMCSVLPLYGEKNQLSSRKKGKTLIYCFRFSRGTVMIAPGATWAAERHKTNVYSLGGFGELHLLTKMDVNNGIVDLICIKYCLQL